MIPTQDQVRHVAKLARLHLSEEEVGLYQHQLSGIFGYINKLSEIDVSSVEQPSHASKKSMNLRKDEVHMPDSPKDLLSVTGQEIIGGYIAIPAIMKK